MNEKIKFYIKEYVECLKKVEKRKAIWDWADTGDLERLRVLLTKDMRKVKIPFKE